MCVSVCVSVCLCVYSYTHTHTHTIYFTKNDKNKNKNNMPVKKKDGIWAHPQWPPQTADYCWRRSLIITKKEYFYKKKYLEPLLNDYRKLRIISGGEAASHHKRNVKFPERMAWAGAWAHNNSNTNSNINSNTNHCSNNISNES